MNSINGGMFLFEINKKIEKRLKKDWKKIEKRLKKNMQIFKRENNCWENLIENIINYKNSKKTYSKYIKNIKKQWKRLNFVELE